MIKLICANALDALPTIGSQSVDCVVTDPPYPCIKRDYGTWTVEEWWALIVDGVIPEIRRILKPTGSAVFILQPNSEHVGQMRGWLWEFMAWVCREWNMVQDVWWWNTSTIPSGVCTPRSRGLTRQSLKACVWCGTPRCYRDQDAVLWEESLDNARMRLQGRLFRQDLPSGHGMNRRQCAHVAVERGGVTPFNVLPIPNSDHATSAGAHGHGGGTPQPLADWWIRYICSPDGVVLDPFAGSGTMMLAAIQNGRNGIGIDKEQQYIEIARQRIEAAQNEMIQAEMALEVA